MQPLIDAYLDFLLIERGLSDNTLSSYRGDLLAYSRYLEDQGLTDPGKVQPSDINSFIVFLRNQGLTARTARRKVVAVRGFHRFLVSSGHLEKNPVENIASVQLPRNLPSHCFLCVFLLRKNTMHPE